MKYHSLKMEEVNETMRHLWNKTYQGTGKLPKPCNMIHADFSKISTGSEFGLTTTELQRHGEPTTTEWLCPKIK